MLRRTKIVATLGPSTNNVEVIKRLIEAGLAVARVNFSHGTYESHTETINYLKQAREELNAPIALMLDTKGPEIRIKTFQNEKIYLEPGQTFTLTTDDVEGDETRVSITYKDLPKDLSVGSKVLIDDGLIELQVEKIEGSNIICRVINSGFLSSRKGVNVPDVYVNLPSLTEKDVEDIKFGIQMGFDYIAASFVRSANDVLNIRDILEKNNGDHIDIIAKIESRDGVNNIDSILEVSDGIMVARGDLGVEIPPEEVPLVQKFLIDKANKLGKPVITATQMLESMVSNPRPTRAEANDVANAIFDGSDAIMLSGETAKGDYPVESIEMMARIAIKTESAIDYNKQLIKRHDGFSTNIINAISYATCTTAADLNAACIATITSSGFTARKVSKFRPGSRIIALTMCDKVWRKLNLLWGCHPMLADSKENLFQQATDLAVEKGFAKTGDAIVIAAGVQAGIAGSTNTLKVQIVGDVLAKGRVISAGKKIVTGRANVVKATEVLSSEFKKGDILITTKTTDEMMPYIKIASAIIVGGANQATDYVHAETVGRALDIPVIICQEKAIDLIPNGIGITIDCKKGFVFNSAKNS